jgi:hypothetical protein
VQHHFAGLRVVQLTAGAAGQVLDERVIDEQFAPGPESDRQGGRGKFHDGS